MGNHHRYGIVVFVGTRACMQAGAGIQGGDLYILSHGDMVSSADGVNRDIQFGGGG
jgi:hypothetical protein